MIGSRLCPRQRRRCRAVGASFIAAAVVPLFAITPLAQADAGHGGPGAADQARIANHLRSIARAQAPQAQPANAAKAPHAKAAVQSAAKGHGQEKVVICHATNSDTNPYVVIEVSVASVKFEGHLAHRNSPNKVWKHATTWNDTTYEAGSAKPDLISDTSTHTYDGSIVTRAYCSARGTTPTPTPTTTTAPSTTTTTGGTPDTTVSGTKTTAPDETHTPPGQTQTPPGQSTTDPGAQVLPTKYTNSPTSDSQANAGADTQVLGEKVSALPRTGADMVGAALLSLLLLTVGGLLLRLSAVRRRRAH
jgi:hypothetical protein